ncbi:MAG TPA: response regulator [Clostridiales bacterium]|nr:response regulator [Clostridiales bacterium]
MYKVILIDDEQWIIKSLKKSIPWNQYGFEVCATAADGKIALEKINEFHPDVVFTDIKMPYMNGLDLIAKAKQSHPDLLSVIISGYAEFEFAKTAIQHKVDGYCIKPIEEEEIIDHLKNFRKELDNLKRSRNNLDLLNCIERNDKKMFKEIYPCAGSICIIVSIGDKITYLEGKPKALYCNVSMNKWLYFLPEPINMQQIEGNLSKNIKGVGIFQINLQTDDLVKGIDEANTRAQQYFFNEDNKVFAGDYDKNKIKTYNQLLNGIIAQVKNKDITALSRSLEEIKIILNSINIVELKKSYSILNTLKYLNITGDDLEEDETWMDQDIIFLNNWSNVEEYFEYFRHEIKILVNIKHESIQIYSGNKLISDVINYIKDNYMKDITLYNLSTEFNINQSYLSQLFKNETGVNFVNYLMNYRISKACSLLLQTDMSINNIAQEVGYDDYLYFRKVFKKVNNMTPTEYREQKMRLINNE